MSRYRTPAATFVAPILALAILCGAAWGWDDGSDDSATLSITGDELKGHVEFLADDAREGRGAGSPGGRAAGDYIAEQFEEFGIEPGFEESYFQEIRDGMRNVVGILRGSDPELRDECVVVGAHYDHMGKGKPGRGRMPGKGDDDIWNGADDNASGTAGVLEIAEAFTLLPTPPKRSVVFILFDAEERGLWGSGRYCKQPVLPMEDTVAMVNLDMIGRGDGKSVALYGAKTGEGLADLVAECNEAVDLDYTVQGRILFASDHAHFYRKQVPVLFFFTGLHMDYHRPSDEADKIQPATMEKVSRLSFLILQRLANHDGRLAFVPQPRPAPRPRRPVLGVYGGVDEKTNQYRIDRIMPNRPAARAGLRPGDILLRFRGTKITKRADLLAALWKVKKDDVVEAQILRDGKEMTIQIPFGRGKKKEWY